MPFPKQAGRPFTQADVESLKQNQRGVYGLYRPGVWIYIGKGNLRLRLLDHLYGDNPCITREGPTHWVGELTTNMDARERQLILEFDPICNRRVG